MGAYKYIARDFTGQRKEGVRQAASSGDVLGWLREQGYIPVSVNALQETVKRQQKSKGRRKRRRTLLLYAGS